MQKRKSINNLGFTFLEIVISISILALIMSVTYSTLTQIIRAKKILDDSRDGKAIADALLSRLVRELQLALPDSPVMPPPKNLNQPRPGQPRLIANRVEKNGSIFSEITFVTLSDRQLLPDGRKQAPIVQISYKTVPAQSINTDSEQLSLVREETPYIKPFEQAYKKSVAFPVAQDLISFEFSFFDERSEKWLNLWPPKNSTPTRLPCLIQMLFKIRSPLGGIQSYSTIVYIPACII
jgi:prepilin-type N-terminal cleavage/methylation domain-containing protein